MKICTLVAVAAVALGMGISLAHAQPPAPQAGVDRREERQQHRIEEGIKHGQLTPDEVSTLEKQEADIKALEDTFKADGKLTKEEAARLRRALNAASLQIWAQRHDTEGNQKSVSRLGKDIVAQDQLTSKIESGDLTRAQARQFLEDFRRMVHIKHALSTENLTADERAKLQAEYNTLLNQYFQMK